MVASRVDSAYYSRFGGFWTDRRDSETLLADRVDRGDLRPELGDLIARFMRDGYVIIPGAVPLDLTARIRDDIDAAWEAPPDGLLIETWSRGKARYVPPAPDLRDASNKMLDLHAHSAAAREAIAAPAVVEFLETIFEARPKAFQSLTFWRGSQQSIHKDTAYVQVADEPMHLAATWIALEDVRPGSGELQYYVGSHRDPDFLFGGEHKWMAGAPRDHTRFLASLRLDARRYGHRKERFLAREGDVLVWHADLAHGGARIKRRGRTRRSLVTHYMPEYDDPPYAREVERAPFEQDGCLFISHHAQI